MTLSDKSSCDTPLRENITDGQKHGSVISKDEVEFTRNNYFIENNTTWGCVCDFKRCIRKCCGRNEIMVNNICKSYSLLVQEAFAKFIHLNDNTTYVIHANGKYCDEGFQAHKKERGDILFIDKNGSISINAKMFNPEAYCVDIFFDETHKYDIAAVICTERPQPNVNSTNSCPEVLSVDISDGIYVEDTITTHGVTFKNTDYYHSNGTVWGCICNKKTCIRKCCGENELIVNKLCEQRLDFRHHHLADMLHNSSFHGDTHHLLFSKGKFCDARFYTVKETNIGILTNGSIVTNDFTLEPNQYCVDTFMVNNTDYQVAAILCLQEDEDAHVDMRVHVSGKLLILLSPNKISFILYFSNAVVSISV